MIINISVFIISIVLFAGVDALVYGKWLINHRDKRLWIVIYRILQIILQAAIVYLDYIYFNNTVAFGFLLTWWYGGCDFLYYCFLPSQYKDISNKPAGEEMDWLKWSVHSIPYLLIKNYKCTWSKFVTTAVVGFVISIGVIIYGSIK